MHENIKGVWHAVLLKTSASIQDESTTKEKYRIQGYNFSKHLCSSVKRELGLVYTTSMLCP